MEDQELKTPLKTHMNFVIHQSPISDNSFCITSSPPDRLRVPKPFKYPERYKSPTDLVMSPISKQLLARSRKTGSLLLPPTKHQNKNQDINFQEIGLFQT